MLNKGALNSGADEAGAAGGLAAGVGGGTDSSALSLERQNDIVTSALKKYQQFKIDINAVMAPSNGPDALGY